MIGLEREQRVWCGESESDVENWLSSLFRVNE